MNAMIFSLKRPWGLSLLALALFLSGLQPFPGTLLSWFAFVPLFLIFLDPKISQRELLIHTLTVGFLFYAIGLYWLIYYQAWVYAVVLLILAPTFSLYFFLLKLIAQKIPDNGLKILAAPLLWIALQTLYAQTPLGTLATETFFYGPLPFLEIAAVIPFFVFGGILVGLSMAAASLIKERSTGNLICTLVFVSLVGGIYFWGSARLSDRDSAFSVRAALVQHNLPIDGIWNLDHPAEIRSKYRELGLKAAESHPQLIVFPLYNFSDDILREPDFFLNLAQETGSFILAASYIPNEPGGNVWNGYYDTAVLYSPEGRIAGEYRAVERPPFRKTHELTDEKYHLLETPFGKIGILLCYEDSRPKTARLARQEGAEVLIALSNPGHFLTTHMPYYHLMQSRLRAIETGLPLVRVSANGYSAVIDSRGRLMAKSELNREEIL